MINSFSERAVDRILNLCENYYLQNNRSFSRGGCEWFSAGSPCSPRCCCRGARSLATTAMAGVATTQMPKILWDQFGIPHIYGPDLLTVVRGLGYAEMENHAETILNRAEIPRLCRGGSNSLTFPEVHRDHRFCEPPSTRKVKSRWTSLKV